MERLVAVPHCVDYTMVRKKHNDDIRAKGKQFFTDSYRKQTFINTPLAHHTYVPAFITHFVRAHILSKVINYLHLRHL